MGPNAPTLNDLMYRYYAAQFPAVLGMDLTNASGNKAAAAANSVLTPAATRTAYINGFDVTGAGATAGSVITVTVTGLALGTLTYDLVVPAGVTTSITPLIVRFPQPLAASAVNTPITVNVPSFGAGNTNAASVAYGFQL